MIELWFCLNIVAVGTQVPRSVLSITDLQAVQYVYIENIIKQEKMQPLENLADVCVRVV